MQKNANFATQNRLKSYIYYATFNYSTGQFITYKEKNYNNY